MFELKRILDFGNRKVQEGKRVLLATIYKTKGSSYRKKWTQMIVADDFTYTGHLSGGCVEQAVLTESEKVFRTKENLTFVYDGQYKLGCKGSIFILLELVDSEAFKNLKEQVELCDEGRIAFIQGMEFGGADEVRTYFQFRAFKIPMSATKNFTEKEETRTVRPQNKVVIVGSEFDGEILANLAMQVGFISNLVVNQNYAIPSDKPYKIFHAEPKTLPSKVNFDSRTALILMTHSFAKDLAFLKEIIYTDLKYFGILGPPRRKEELLENLFENFSENNLELIDKIENIKSPIGLNIGSKIPEEIAISILAELIQVFNKTN